MLNQENNPERCKQLRENLGEIQSQFSKLKQAENAKRSELLELREQLSTAYSRLEELSEAQMALGLGAILKGGPSLGASASSVDAAVRISQLKHQIGELERRIEALKRDLAQIQTNKDRLTQYEGETGRELTQLNCIVS